MDAHAQAIVGKVRARDARAIRTTLAYSLVMLGVAGTLAVVPVAIWALVARGFH